MHHISDLDLDAVLDLDLDIESVARKIFLGLLGLGLSLLIPQAVTAEEKQHYYVELSLGQSLLGEDAFFADAAGLPVGDAEVDYDTGFTSGFAFGYRPTPRWRIETEYLYRTDELSSAEFSDGTLFEDGDFSSVTLSLNAYYSFRLWTSSTSDQTVDFYVGAGLGWIQEVDIDLERDGQEVEFETDDTGFQWMLGLDWQFSERWSGVFEFRSFAASDVEMRGETGLVRSDYTPVNLILALGYRF